MESWKTVLSILSWIFEVLREWISLDYQHSFFKNQGAWRRANIAMNLKQIIKLILVDATTV